MYNVIYCNVTYFFSNYPNLTRQRGTKAFTELRRGHTWPRQTPYKSEAQLLIKVINSTARLTGDSVHVPLAWATEVEAGRESSQ